jgi:hypothetical protein
MGIFPPSGKRRETERWEKKGSERELKESVGACGRKVFGKNWSQEKEVFGVGVQG